jgi:hypothetical protein
MGRLSVLGSDILEVAIGLVFIYLLMSLVATAAREAVEGLLKKRGRALEQGLMELFGHAAILADAKAAVTQDLQAKAAALHAQAVDADQALYAAAGLADRTIQAAAMAAPAVDIADTLLERFYNHPLIFSLFRGDYHPPELRTLMPFRHTTTGGMLPSYIPSANFADALLEVAESYLKPGTGGAPLSFDRLTAAAWAVPNIPVRRMLLLALTSAKGDIDALRKYLQDWYDGVMDRISGWYRRQTQWIVFVFGLILCVALNVNTVVIGHALHESAALRGAVGAAAAKWATDNAGSFAPSPPPKDGTAPAPNFQVPYDHLQALGLPIGWGVQVRALMDANAHPNGQKSLSGVGALEIAVGWLITAFAIMLGAPFWFDVLNLFMVVRSTVKPTEKSPDESSKDTQPSKDPTGKPAPGAANAAAPVPGAGAPAAAQPAPPSDADALDIALLDPALRPREEITLAQVQA